jgi:hypothetical protein
MEQEAEMDDGIQRELRNLVGREPRSVGAPI